MPEYLAPGVYVEEVDSGAKPIEGVSTSTAGMLGVTERGPVNTPILITSTGEFSRWFGGGLNRIDFSNANGAHCYLPHAVEGFFSNGGKRVYITRVLDTAGAGSALTQLFDRGDAASATTRLLRSIDEQTGTAANLPLAYALDISDLTVGDWIRIGDGSNADYRQVALLGTAANNTHVSINFPLSFSHALGDSVDQFDRTEDIPPTVGANYTAVFTLAAAADVADTTLELQGAAADITTLEANVSAAVETLIEIDGSDGEYHFVAEVTITATDRARVRLASPLRMDHAAASTVTPLVIGSINNANLGLAAGAGACLIYVDDRGGNFDVRTTLVLVDNADASRREVRRIGDLSLLHLTAGAYEAYPAGSLVEAVVLADDDRTLAAGPSVVGDTSITLDDASGLAVGDTVIIGADVPATAENATLLLIDTATNQITLTAGMANVHNAGEVVQPVAKSTTSAVEADSSVIALDNRLGLSTGDVLRIGTAPDDEYVTVDSLPGTSGVAPDAGNVILQQALVNTHTAGTEVRRQTPPTSAGLQSCVLGLDAEEGAQICTVSDGDSYVQDGYMRVTTPSAEQFYHRLSADAESSLGGDFTPATVTLTEAVARPHTAGSAMVGREALITAQALDAGAWGNRLRVMVEDEESGLVSRASVTGMVNPTTLRLSSLSGVEAGSVLELLHPTSGTVVGDAVKVNAISRSDGTATLAAALSVEQQDTLALEGSLSVRSREFRLGVMLLRQPDPALPSRNDTVIASEVFRHLSLDHRHSRYVERVVGDIDGDLRLSDRRPEGESWYIRVRDQAANQAELESVRLGPEILVDILPDGREQPARQALIHGNDSVDTITDATYIGVDDREPANRTGLFSFRNHDDISLVACPGRTSSRMQGTLINHCELMRYRFAVLDGTPPPNDSLNDIQAQRQQFDTKYAALYHPWLLVPDPYPTNLAQVADYSLPPSGHMLGVYARTDIERGVHKAPANEVVRGITGLQRSLNKGEHDILNPVNINVIRDFRRDNRGIRIWGGRVITSDSDWKYVNVRRLLIFIEASIDRGLQWVVFEPNAEPLWARVRRTVSNFLTVVWRNGALEGTKTEEAFFVKCDRTTMTQTDIDNGRLICVIGVAPVKPAEFVIIRIGLWTAHAED